MSSQRTDKTTLTLKSIDQLILSLSIDWAMDRLRQRFRVKGCCMNLITEVGSSRLQKFLRLSFEVFLLMRLQPLITEPYAQKLTKCQNLLKEEYLRLYIGWPAKRQAAYSMLVVIVSQMIEEHLRYQMPEIAMTPRLSYDIHHVIVAMTLGIFIGDASVRFLSSKYLKPKKFSEIRQIDYQEHKIQTIDEPDMTEEAQVFMRDVKEQLKTMPIELPRIQPKNIDEEKENKESRSNIERRLKNYHIFSNQVSLSLADVKKERGSLLPFIKPTKIACDLECVSSIYEKKLASIPQERPAQVFRPPPRKEPVNKRSLLYWKQKLDVLKGDPEERILKEIMEAIFAKDEDSSDEEENQDIVSAMIVDNRKPTETVSLPVSQRIIFDDVRRIHEQKNMKNDDSITLSQPRKEEETPVPEVKNSKKKKFKSKAKLWRRAKAQFESQCISGRMQMLQRESKCLR